MYTLLVRFGSHIQIAVILTDPYQDNLTLKIMLSENILQLARAVSIMQLARAVSSLLKVDILQRNAK